MFAHAVAHSDDRCFGSVAASALSPEDLAAPTRLPHWRVDMAMEEASAPLYMFGVVGAISMASRAIIHADGDSMTLVLRIGDKAAIAAPIKAPASLTWAISAGVSGDWNPVV